MSFLHIFQKILDANKTQQISHTLNLHSPIPLRHVPFQPLTAAVAANITLHSFRMSSTIVHFSHRELQRLPHYCCVFRSNLRRPHLLPHLKRICTPIKLSILHHMNPNATVHSTMFAFGTSVYFSISRSHILWPQIRGAFQSSCLGMLLISRTQPISRSTLKRLAKPNIIGHFSLREPAGSCCLFLKTVWAA